VTTVLRLCLIVSALCFAASLAHAAPPRYPTKFTAGLHPLGAQISFTNGTPGGYRLMLDAAGRLHGWESGAAVWLGGGLNYGYGTYNLPGGHNPQIDLFAMFTFTTGRIGLMPFVKAGPVLDFLVAGGALSAVGGGVRFGGGLHYFITRNIGVGMETNFTLGGASGGGVSNFYGHWDFGFGMRAGL
jgi:hypothetical protein